MAAVNRSNNSITKADQSEEKAANSKEVAVTHIRWERALFGILWVAFCLCLDNIIKWACFVLFYHGLSVTLFDAGVWKIMSNRQ